MRGAKLTLENKVKLNRFRVSTSFTIILPVSEFQSGETSGIQGLDV